VGGAVLFDDAARHQDHSPLTGNLACPTVDVAVPQFDAQSIPRQLSKPEIDHTSRDHLCPTAIQRFDAQDAYSNPPPPERVINASAEGIELTTIMRRRALPNCLLLL